MNIIKSTESTTELAFSESILDELETPSEGYSDYMAKIELPAALMGGTETMRAAGKKFLGQEEAESEEGWQNRLDRTFLLNSYRRTVKKLSGEVFSKPVVYNEKMDERLLACMNDFDLEGNNINVVGFRHFADSLAYGVSHVLVDYPETNIKERNGIDYIEGDEGEEIYSRKIEKDRQFRPYASIIPSSNIIGWRFASKNGVRKLASVRICDWTTVPDGLFRDRHAKRIRILFPGRYLTYMQGDEGWNLVGEGNTGLDYIPLFSYFTGTDKFGLTCESAMMDLAWLNLEHWQSASDHRNQLHYASMITFLGVALDNVLENKKVVIGCNQIVHTSDTGGDLRVVEHSGKAIEAGANNLRHIETAMNTFGLSMVDSKKDRETATSRLLDSLESTSTLKNWAILYDDLLNNIVNCMSDYLNISLPDENLIKVNTDLIPTYGEISTQLLLDSFRERVIDQETLLIEYKRRGVLRDRANIAEIMKKAKQEQKELDKKEEKKEKDKEKNKEGGELDQMLNMASQSMEQPSTKEKEDKDKKNEE